MSFRNLSLAFAAIVTAASLATTTAAAQEVVRLGNLKFAHYGAVSYMKELAPKYGLKIEENMFAKGADIYPAVAAGAIDIAASAVDGAIAARGNGVPLVLVAGFSNGGARIVVKPGSAIKSVADLKGKKVATARGGAHELLLLASLDKAGLTWSDKPGKDVEVLLLGYPELNQALASGLVDAICQSEPQSSIAIKRGIGEELNKPYDTPVGVPVRALVMTERMLKDKPEVAQKVLNLLVEATNAFVKDPALAEKYVRDDVFKGSFSAEEYKASMENAAFSTEIDEKHVQVTTDLMVKYGLGKMANPPKAADWVKLDMLAKAKAAAPK
ncbi:MAG: ABC transporter substrate-binding protein [Hyphomicrobiaceae bacterium]|nr:ABC transporter substrate-binding protein [Hyphomicrobiaceae bacterium]